MMTQPTTAAETTHAADAAHLDRLRRINPGADPRAQLGVPASRVPEHVAIIMDGNGRWAGQRGLDRTAGHAAGAPRVRDVLTRCGELGIGYLTLYSFSTENWRRPKAEVAALMNLFVHHLAAERDELVANNVRLRMIGRRTGLESRALEELDRTLEATESCTGTTLSLAVNYSSRAELTDAVRAIAEQVKAGEFAPSDIEEATIADHLYTAGTPDPDLLIRTGGELRVSNYLLWQISYAELYVCDTLWPDFDAAAFDEALRAYAVRDRRFGGLGDQTTTTPANGDAVAPRDGR
jgi:undecaprenyl diphosphate synthase